MAEDREPSLQHAVWRLEERQQQDRAILAEYKARIDSIEKQIVEMKLSIQWLQWHETEAQAGVKDLGPLVKQVVQASAFDPALVRVVIGSLLAAVLGLAVGNFALFSG